MPPPNVKRRSGTNGSPASQGPMNDDDIGQTAVLPGRKDGRPRVASTADPDEEVGVTCDCCPDCGDTSTSNRWASAPDSMGDTGPTATRTHPVQPPLLPVRLAMGRDGCNTPDCPDEGQFGVNVIAQSALSRYDHRLPIGRSIASDSNYTDSNSPASAWRAGRRCARQSLQNEQIRREIKMRQ